MSCKITIKISQEGKKDLDELKIHPKQTYNEIINLLINKEKVRIRNETS